MSKGLSGAAGDVLHALFSGWVKICDWFKAHAEAKDVAAVAAARAAEDKIYGTFCWLALVLSRVITSG